MQPSSLSQGDLSKSLYIYRMAYSFFEILKPICSMGSSRSSDWNQKVLVVTSALVI